MRDTRSVLVLCIYGAKCRICYKLCAPLRSITHSARPTKSDLIGCITPEFITDMFQLFYLNYKFLSNVIVVCTPIQLN